MNTYRFVLQYLQSIKTKNNHHGIIHYFIKIYGMKKLDKIKVAILTENGFEQVELTSPKVALEKAGAKVDVISPQRGKVKAWNKTDWGIKVKVDKELSNVKPADYDALILPGGVMNPDKLRQNGDAVNFVKEFLQSGKPIAAICHGPQILIETGLLKGKTMTSFPSLQTDLKNAGVNWVDEEIVHFENLITSRKPADLDAFNKKLIKTLSLKEQYL
jgi:protease I